MSRPLADHTSFTAVPLQRLIFLDDNHVLRGRWTVPALSISGDLSALSLNSQRPDRLLRLDTDQGWERLVVTGQVYSAEVRNATEDTRLNGYSLRQEANRRVRVSGDWLEMRLTGG